jgi:hypothetical protein
LKAWPLNGGQHNLLLYLRRQIKSGVIDFHKLKHIFPSKGFSAVLVLRKKSPIHSVINIGECENALLFAIFFQIDGQLLKLHRTGVFEGRELPVSTDHYHSPKRA